MDDNITYLNDKFYNWYITKILRHIGKGVTKMELRNFYRFPI